MVRREVTMKNKLIDLNNHLFAELERLGDEELTGDELTGDELTQEVERAKSITGIAQQIVSNAQVTLKAVELQCEYMDRNIGLGGFLGDSSQE